MTLASSMTTTGDEETSQVPPVATVTEAKRRKKLPKESVDNEKDRLIARTRSWEPTWTRKVNGVLEDGDYGPYIEIFEKDLEDEAALQRRVGPGVSVVTNQNGKKAIRVQYRRGGEMTYFSRLLDDDTRHRVAQEIHGPTAASYFRSYSFNRSHHKEPRLHFLASSDATFSKRIKQPCYNYHSTIMKAVPLKTLPELSKLSKQLAKDFKVPNGVFNIGVDVILYRDGTDYIGWHADDTQQEEIILSVTPISPSEPRKLRTRPKGLKSSFVAGDEEWEFFVGAGDTYIMDGDMQKHYEHQVPKTTNKGERAALIFRHGERRYVLDESPSTRPETLEAPDRTVEYIFGGMDCLKEGTLYPRGYLVETKAHRSEMAGVSGNSQVGADAIVVNDSDSTKRELDRFQWLLYSAPSKSKCGALFKSSQTGLPVRVFRSSAATSNPFRPPASKSTRLRYDGPYKVIRVWDEAGNLSPASCPSHSMYTFLLFRQQPAGSPGASAVIKECVESGLMMEEALRFFKRDMPPRSLAPLPNEVLPTGNAYKLPNPM